MKTYDHYLTDPTDIEECLSQISENGETIISTTYLTDSNQLFILVEKKPDFKSVKKFLGVKEKEQEEE